MSLAAVFLIAWFVIITLVMIPKQLTLTEMVFIHFVSSIMTVSVFTLFDINLQWVTAARTVERSLALHVVRFIEIPLLLIIASEVLTSSVRKRWRWTIAAAICTFLTLNDWVLVQLGILEFRRWNYGYAFLEYGMFVVLIGLVARWFVGLDRGDSGNLASDRV